MIELGSLIRDLLMVGFGVVISSTTWLIFIVRRMGDADRKIIGGDFGMRTFEEIMRDGIKDSDWTYCKAEYAPHDGCRVGMPEKCTPNGATRDEVETCYIITAKLRNGDILALNEMMYLSDGRFYNYGNLWNDDEIVDQELSDEWYSEPVAWIAYKNVPEGDVSLPIAPCNGDAIPTPKANEE